MPARPRDPPRHGEVCAGRPRGARPDGKSADFTLRTRARALGAPTQLAAKIFNAGRDLLARETGENSGRITRFRLIGIGVSALADAADADPADLVDQRGRRSAAAEHAVDRLREKFGRSAVIRGIAWKEDRE